MRIDATLESYGISAAELAATSGVSESQISRIRRGESQPRKETAGRLRDGLVRLINSRIGQTHTIARAARADGLQGEGEVIVLYNLEAVEVATAPPSGAKYDR